MTHNEADTYGSAPSRRFYSPFDIAFDPMESLALFDFEDDPEYTGLEVQLFDDEAKGRGTAALMWRVDGKVDFYMTPGITLNREATNVGKGVGEWITQDFDCQFAITPRGIDADTALTLKDGRPLTFRTREARRRVTRPVTMLAPLGTDIERPTFLPIFRMHNIDLLQRAHAEIDWRLGETWALSMEYNLLAGQQAKQVYANQQSIEFFHNALRSARELSESDTMVQRRTIQLALGELLVSTGQYEDAFDHLEEAIQLTQGMGEREPEARACRWFARAHELRGEYELALAWLDKGFALLDPGESPEEAELALIAGLIQSRQGDYDQALQFCERSLDVAEELDDAAVRARTYNLMGIVDRRRGRCDAALDRFQLSLAQYEELGNVYGQATSHNLIANGYFTRSQWRRAEPHYRRSLEMFTEIGDNYNQASACNNLGGIALKQGRLDTALDYYQHAIRLLEQTGGSLFIIGVVRMNLGSSLIRRRELEPAVCELQMAHDHFRQATIRDLLPELYGLFAEVALLKGDTVEAAEMGRRSVELAQELEMPCEEGHNLRILGEIAQADQRFDQAEHYFLNSDRVLTQVGDKYERAKTQLALARLYSGQGQTERAETALNRCEGIFTLLDAELDLETVREMRRTLGNRLSN